MKKFSDDAVLKTGLSQYALPIDQIKSGDIGFAHSTDIMGKLIRFFTRSEVNHTFTVVEVPDNPTPETVVVIQAQLKGVSYATLASVAPGGTVWVLPLLPSLNRDLMVAQNKVMLRVKYAVVSIVSTFINLFPLPVRLDVSLRSSIFCSALTWTGLMVAGLAEEVPDIYQVVPGWLADKYLSLLQASVTHGG